MWSTYHGCITPPLPLYEMIIIKKKTGEKNLWTNSNVIITQFYFIQQNNTYTVTYFQYFKKTCEFIQPIPTRVYKTLLTLYPRKNLGWVSPDPGLLVWSGEHRPNNTAARKPFIAQFEKQDAKTIIFLSILA